ncbi:EthD family reductase [Sphingomonas morindae]|uniref:EthD family reductase n=1 Tax=Sphingomonas morindae TaxID=1541170 RepID=A0ABY4XD88_9SPHN|nr:EthD family reductase [Sphingomonas morindae]USI74645.1 EthD family reductase [Sphingomonas morindae]
MNDGKQAVRTFVYYEGASDARFDRDFYTNHHLPLCLDSWGRYGLQSARAFYAADGAAGTLVICECIFRDEEALQAAFASPETRAVMADVPRFTDLTPIRTRPVPMDPFPSVD